MSDNANLLDMAEGRRVGRFLQYVVAENAVMR